MLEKTDFGLRLEREEYEKRLKALKNRIGPLGFEVYRKEKPVIILMEGPDASGKGGAIKRFTLSIPGASSSGPSALPTATTGSGTIFSGSGKGFPRRAR